MESPLFYFEIVVDKVEDTVKTHLFFVSIYGIISLLFYVWSFPTASIIQLFRSVFHFAPVVQSVGEYGTTPVSAVLNSITQSIFSVNLVAFSLVLTVAIPKLIQMDKFRNLMDQPTI